MSWSWAEVEAALPDREHLTGAEPFFTDPETRGMVHASVRRVCHRFSIRPDQFEDIEQEAWLLLWQMLTDEAAFAAAHRVRDGLGVAFFLRLGDRVKKLVESAEWTGRSGMSGSVRRRRDMAMLRRRLELDLHRTVDDNELVETYNAQIAERRTASDRLGKASLSDLVDQTVPLQDHEDPSVLGTIDDTPLLGVEARELIEATIEHVAAADDPDLLRVTLAWIGHATDEPPYIATTREIVKETGLPQGVVRELLVQATLLCREVLAERFGIRAA